LFVATGALRREAGDTRSPQMQAISYDESDAGRPRPRGEMIFVWSKDSLNSRVSYATE
jgi:hypothetical protein